MLIKMMQAVIHKDKHVASPNMVLICQEIKVTVTLHCLCCKVFGVIYGFQESSVTYFILFIH